jgi:hypothetical protein
MKIKDAKMIQLTYEQIDVVVLQELKDIYEQQLAEIDRLNDLPALKEYQIADRAHSKELRDAARVLIEYHMPIVEATEYFLSLKKAIPTSVTNTHYQREKRHQHTHNALERDY